MFVQKFSHCFNTALSCAHLPRTRRSSRYRYVWCTKYTKHLEGKRKRKKERAKEEQTRKRRGEISRDSWKMHRSGRNLRGQIGRAAGERLLQESERDTVPPNYRKLAIVLRTPEICGSRNRVAATYLTLSHNLHSAANVSFAVENYERNSGSNLDEGIGR